MNGEWLITLAALTRGQRRTEHEHGSLLNRHGTRAAPRHALRDFRGVGQRFGVGATHKQAGDAVGHTQRSGEDSGGGSDWMDVKESGVVEIVEMRYVRTS